MTIQPNTNVESSKLLRDVFPKDDEDTFIADAETQIAKVTELYHLADELTAAQRVTQETLQGETGQAYHESMHASREQILGMANDHLNLAKALEVAASNIATTKTNLNNIDYQYHEDMQRLQEWSMTNDVPQYEVMEQRANMLDRALEAVDTSAQQLEVSQSQVATAVKNGVPVDYSALIPLREGAEPTKYTLPEAGGGAYVIPEYRSGLTSDMERTITSAARPSHLSDTSASAVATAAVPSTSRDFATRTSSATSSGDTSTYSSNMSSGPASMLRKPVGETSLSAAGGVSLSAGVPGAKVTAPQSTTVSGAAPGASAVSSGAPAASAGGVMPMAGMATAKAANAPLATPAQTGTAEKSATSSPQARKLNAGFAPEDVLPRGTARTKGEEQEDTERRGDLQKALDRVAESELLADLPRGLQASVIVAANLWSGLQVSGWDGAVVVAPVQGSDDQFVYVTEHLVSFIPHSLATHPHLTPAQTYLSEEEYSAALTSDMMTTLSAIPDIDLTYAVVVAPSTPTDAFALALSPAQAHDIAASFEVRDGQLTRKAVQFSPVSPEDVEEIVALADKELRQALLDVVFAAHSEQGEYVSALRAFVASAMRVAHTQGWDEDFAYLASAFRAL